MTLIILTNGLSAIRDVLCLSPPPSFLTVFQRDLPLLKEDSGGELYTSGVRWDHRIITYIVNNKSENSSEPFLSTSLARLSQVFPPRFFT